MWNLILEADPVRPPLHVRRYAAKGKSDQHQLGGVFKQPALGGVFKQPASLCFGNRTKWFG